MMRERHLDMSEALAVRDGTAPADARWHVESCEHCRAEVQRLRDVRSRLRALSTLRPSRDLWPDIARDLGRSRRRSAWVLVGLAAAAVLAGVLVLDSGRLGDEESRRIAESPAGGELRPLIAESQELESLLNDYRPGHRVVDARTALAVSVLEDRMTLIDEALAESQMGRSDAAVVRSLWRERVNTLETLVNLQVAGHPSRARR